MDPTTEVQLLMRLFPIALQDTGQARRVADFLLAWHNAADNCGWDPPISGLWTTPWRTIFWPCCAFSGSTGSIRTTSASGTRSNGCGPGGGGRANERSGRRFPFKGGSRGRGGPGSGFCAAGSAESRSCAARACAAPVMTPRTTRKPILAGTKEEVLARDGRRCRVCGTGTDIVHLRRPGRHDPAGLLALCAACHATVHRLQTVDRYLPPLLLVLWREQHPAASAGQLQFGWDEGQPA